MVFIKSVLDNNNDRSCHTNWLPLLLLTEPLVEGRKGLRWEGKRKGVTELGDPGSWLPWSSHLKVTGPPASAVLSLLHSKSSLETDVLPLIIFGNLWLFERELDELVLTSDSGSIRFSSIFWTFVFCMDVVVSGWCSGLFFSHMSQTNSCGTLIFLTTLSALRKVFGFSGPLMKLSS